MSVDIRAVRTTARPTPGDQDFTISGFGTPVAALFFFGNLCDTDAQEEAGGGLCIGATDGTRDRAACVMRLTGAATTSTASSQSSSNCMKSIFDAGGTDSLASFVSFITDGVRVNWSDAPSGQPFITCVLFGGSDIVNVHVNHFEPDAVENNTVDVTDPGFEPNVLICFGCGNVQADQTRNTISCLQLGFITNDGVTVLQNGLAQNNRDNVSTVQLASQVRTDRGYPTIGGANTDQGNLSFGTFDSSGFTVTTLDNALSFRETVGYLALELSASSAAWTGVIDTPTATGNDAQTGPGFEPEAVFLGFGMNATGVDFESDDDAGGQGIGFFNENEEFCNSTRDDSGASTTAPNAVAENVAIRQNDIDASTAMYRATFVSMDTNGWTLNYDTVDATARRTLALAIQTVAVGGSVPRRIFTKVKEPPHDWLVW